MRARLTPALVLAGALAAAGCGSSSGPQVPTVGAARTFEIAGFQPAGAIRAGRPTRVSFRIDQPSGAPLTRYRRGAGPHTGVHLIFVRDDLSTIVHRHPPIRPDGRIADTIRFPEPGRYRLLVDVYPRLAGQLRNFQLHRDVDVAGPYSPQSVPPFRATDTVDGFRFRMDGRPRLRDLRPAFLDVDVTAPDGRPASFTPWYGALAHAIFFRKGSLDYFHTHVCGPDTPGCAAFLGGTSVTGEATAPGELRVGVLLPLPGTWRLFLQTKANGNVMTAPFTLHVR